MDWEKLKTFYYVADVGSFTKASQILNLTQSAVSRKIQDIEHRLKVKLFIRHPRHLVLTPQGEILFEASRKMFQEAKAAQNLIEEQEVEPAGHLKVASTVGFLADYIAPHIPQFIDHYPKISLSLIATDLPPNLDVREADLTIHPSIIKEGGFTHTYLTSSYFKLYASPEYLKKFGVPETPLDLDHHRLISFGGYNNLPFPEMDWHLKVGKRAGQVRKPFLEINLARARVTFAQKGLGIISIDKNNPLLKGTGLVEVLPEVTGYTLRLYCIYPKQMEKSKKVQVFMDYFSNIYKDEAFVN